MSSHIRSFAAGLAILLGLAAAPSRAQQMADSTFAPVVAHPAYAWGSGPVVAIDAAHHDFHTLDGRYAPFADLLRKDGYVLRANTAPFDSAALEGIRILVIANALAAENETTWAVPNWPAFTGAEIEAVRRWVERGGSLWLMIDHMPFPAAAGDLARAFGFSFRNGYAVRKSGSYHETFRRSDGSLKPHPLLDGRSPDEAVDSVTTFTGSAFQAVPGASPLFVLGPDYMSAEPVDPAVHGPDTPRFPVGGWLQGAVRTYGRGRVAIFGEAAMFSAQVSGPIRMGMNAPEAPENVRFLLNVAHWLTGLIPGE